MAIQICLYGPTGSGKSTIARHLVETFDAELIKVAEPLYELQRLFYQRIDKVVDGQDGELLQFFADKIEREQPNWLGRQFLARARACTRPIVVNDDCRLNAYHALRAAGFTFVRVRASAEHIAARLRADHTTVDPRHPVEQGFERFRRDGEVANDGTLADAFTAVDAMVRALVSRSG